MPNTPKKPTVVCNLFGIVNLKTAQRSGLFYVCSKAISNKKAAHKDGFTVLLNLFSVQKSELQKKILFLPCRKD